MSEEKIIEMMKEIQKNENAMSTFRKLLVLNTLSYEKIVELVYSQYCV